MTAIGLSPGFQRHLRKSLARPTQRRKPWYPVASLSLQIGLSPPASTRANDDAYQSIIFSPVTWAAIAFTKSS